jgi:SAM-dependent methyltransferase
MSYAPPAHWDNFYQRHVLSGTDLDWGNQWTQAFVDVFRANSITRILDLGCGTGNDVVRLANVGFQVTGLDYSSIALEQTAKKLPALTSFVQADMAQPLPFAASGFDAVMSNVAMHMFSDSITRKLFAEIRRIVRPHGLFVFHLNALEDRPLRNQFNPAVKEIEPDYVLEQNGQTMHFFSEAYIRDLLSSWSEIDLEFVEILHRETQEPYKRVWRGIFRK